MTPINFLVVTALAAGAVKQLAYALKSGSWFGPLRAHIARNAQRGRFGFRTLNELMTCPLCLTMQVALWTVTVPLIVLSIVLPMPPSGFGDGLAWHLFAALVSFLYGMAVSFFALAFWNVVEYPAARYHAAIAALDDAKNLIKELETQLENRGIEPARPQASSTLSRADVGSLLEALEECMDHGCGYSRRGCRRQNLQTWFDTWAKGSAGRAAVRWETQRAVADHLSSFFRNSNERLKGQAYTDAVDALYDRIRAMQVPQAA